METEIRAINEAQREFLFCSKRFSCWDGGVWTGKTSGAVLKMHLLCSMFPGSRWAVFRYTEEDLKRTIYKSFKQLVPYDFFDPRHGGKDIDGYTKYINGSEILWMHLKDLNMKALMSLELSGFIVSQAEECEASTYEMLETRLRHRPVGFGTEEYLNRLAPAVRERLVRREDGTYHFPQYGVIECNPNGKDWIYYKFHPSQCQDPENYAYLFTTTEQNGEKLKAENPDYYRTLCSKPESWKRRYFYGSREVSEGAWHKGFSRKVHCYDPEEFDLFKQRKIRAVYYFYDYGLSAETCYEAMALDNEGFRWFFREWYGIKDTIKSNARKLQMMEKEIHDEVGGQPEGRYADPSIFFKLKADSQAAIASGNLSVADEYAQEGLDFLPADNSQQTAFEHIEEGLKVDQSRIHPVTMKAGCPKYFFSLACSNLVAQIEQQRKKLKRNPLTGETEYVDERAEGIPDHAYDTLCYAANFNVMNYARYTGEMPRAIARHIQRPLDNVVQKKSHWYSIRA